MIIFQMFHEMGYKYNAYCGIVSGVLEDFLKGYKRLLEKEVIGNLNDGFGMRCITQMK